MNRLKDNEEYLTCRYDTRQSFYGKAKVETNEHKGLHGHTRLLNLISYDTLVAKVYYSEIDNKKKVEYLCMGKYSQTTTRHQKEFFKQNGLNDKEIKEVFDKGELIKND